MHLAYSGYAGWVVNNCTGQVTRSLQGERVGPLSKALGKHSREMMGQANPSELSHHW
jgi:hypothetical protein